MTQKDYTQIKEMFYGDVLTFTEIVERLMLIENLINNRQ